jgi:hypothetical protein
MNGRASWENTLIAFNSILLAREVLSSHHLLIEG